MNVLEFNNQQLSLPSSSLSPTPAVKGNTDGERGEFRRLQRLLRLPSISFVDGSMGKVSAGKNAISFLSFVDDVAWWRPMGRRQRRRVAVAVVFFSGVRFATWPGSSVSRRAKAGRRKKEGWAVQAAARFNGAPTSV
nr:hypothetical protein Iba_chr15cCG6630 [Ipomoea batatas]